MQQSPLFFYVFFALFCLAMGSLLNVIIYRLPLMLQAEWASECRTILLLPEVESSKINLFYPRSFCPACEKQIPFWHNIPLLSYCLLRGRCRQCHQSIPLRYPFVEALTLVLSLSAAHLFGFHVSLIFILLFIWLLICLSMIDLTHQLLPDQLTYALLWLGLIVNTQHLFTSLPNAVLSAVGAYVALWLFIKLFFLIRKKVGMGHGDFKLFAAFGAWFGWTQLPLILLISSLLGAVTGVVYLKATKKTTDTPIPFGPFLCVAGLTSLFFGPSIFDWYVGYLK
ncbi:MAG: A24 family peptidase [Legionellales bacterium]|nr:A24 family peptidase [Legionellales bacterium]